ncbi:MAG: glycoside hydrolase family 3 C-terminal domain-containing protein [Polyangiaceae bacterium]|nr:glycoside hydrolase family 3 C-terminal domain-containing protein [Polyangiaceae bacterium]
MIPSPTLPFQNPELDVRDRAKDLVSRLTIEEKTKQLLHEVPGVPRLGIPSYNWWNECLHGVARAGVATVFPQAIGLAAMFDAKRLHRVAIVISDEARAKHHEYVRQGDRGAYKGLTFWTPNINIFRDPRWGRGHETYGECPFLTSRLAVAFIKGLQGDDPRYLKLVATAKHFAVHSGPEHLRHEFDAVVTPKDLRETYLPAFHACVTEAKVQSVMSAYNRVNGEACCGSPTLLQKILRDEWGFSGYVVSDCWAIRDFHESHHLTAGPAESVQLALRSGCDLNCGCTFEHVPNALARGLITETDLDGAVERLFAARIRLGMFDPPDQVPYAAIPYEVNDCDAHRALALDSARASIVLLKNADNLLPLSPDIDSIAVIGPNAYDHKVLVANYFGIPSRAVTPLEGIRAAVSPKTRVLYAQGCNHAGTAIEGHNPDGHLAEARSVAERSSVVVLCLGLNAEIEGEQGDVGNEDVGGDKADLALTGLQQRMLEEIVELGKPTVLVLLAGSPLSITWAVEHVGAIIDAWYPGGEGGIAIADVLFGRVSPAGRLPVTFPASIDHVPPMVEYSMEGRTYRYARNEPLFPFGFGLSYATFEYSELALSAPRIAAGDSVEVSATITNTGGCASDEVVQLYVTDLDSSCRVPLRELRGFCRIHLPAGESRQVTFTLTPKDLSLIDETGARLLEPGRFLITVGGSQPDARSVALMGRSPLATELEVTGKVLALPY